MAGVRERATAHARHFHPDPASNRYSSMSHDRLSSSQRAKRLLLLGVAGAVIVLAGRAIRPFGSSATPPARGGQPAKAIVAPAHSGKELGQLVGRDLRVVVHSAPEGPLYSVVAANGEILAANLTETEVGQQFPGLEIETMTADVHPDGRGLPDR
jgi:hypothetical protein